ncbi:AsnC family transcriptional regulator [Micromonospora cremea]|uniref:AsnC family transcriptional regulator n=1 Tax=Micromonospora cremea TaxID=709881 RepID=UPI0026A99A33
MSSIGILTELQEDGRLPITELSRRVKPSASAANVVCSATLPHRGPRPSQPRP